MALPMMNAIEFGAEPQTAEPTSNTKTAARKVYLTLKMVYNFPNTNKKAQFKSRKAVPYQPISFAEWSSLVIWGMAVEMMSLSCVRGY
jgi:hypothetical protein